ncbi:MAG: ATP-binding cassette domain-containing protein [Planktomarina sp.]
MKLFSRSDLENAAAVLPQIFSPKEMEEAEEEHTAVHMNDRGLPRWANYLAVFFAFATGLCILGLGLTLHMLLTWVVIDKNAYAALPLMAVGALPLFGLWVFEWTQAKAFVGLQAVRASSVRAARAFVGVGLTTMMALIHPYLMAPVIGTVLICYLWLSAHWAFGREEPLWDYSAAEAVSVLLGRDQAGLDMARAQNNAPVGTTITPLLAISVALLFSMSLGVWMVAKSILAMPALAVVTLLSVWSSWTIVAWVSDHMRGRRAAKDKDQSTKVYLRPIPNDLIKSTDPNATIVHQLNVADSQAKSLLSNVSFTIEPGECVGVLGQSAAGKSVLLQSLIDPYGIPGATVQGAVMHRRHGLWERTTADQPILAAHIHHLPKILPTSGQDNLMAFQSDAHYSRAKAALESMVHSSNVVSRILNATNAQRLSLTDQRAIEFARMFFLSPSLLLLDRPEAFTTQALMKAFVDRLHAEKRAGRSLLIVSEYRSLLEMCDRFLVVEDGRIVDSGPRDEIFARESSGWRRFTCARRLESESILENWIRSQFKRNGDDDNRNRAGDVAKELLAFSCLEAAPLSEENLIFDFKFVDKAVCLKVTDTGQLLSTGQIQMAQRAAAQDGGVPDSALARIMQKSSQVEQMRQNGQRVLILHIPIYDPRTGARALNVSAE